MPKILQGYCTPFAVESQTERNFGLSGPNTSSSKALKADAFSHASYYSAGSSTENAAPPVSPSSTMIFPPWSCTISRAMHSPRP